MYNYYKFKDYYLITFYFLYIILSSFQGAYLISIDLYIDCIVPFKRTMQVP
jgi:hypothetical protein